MKKPLLLQAIAVLIIMFSANPARANMLYNASFEQGDRGIFGTIWFPGWSTQGSNGAVTREFNYPYGLGNSVKLWYNDTSLYQS